MSKHTINMIAPSGTPHRRVRLAKTMKLLADNYEQDIIYWGWRRQENEPLADGMDGVVKNRALISGGGYRSKKARLYYLWWMARVFFAVLFTGPRRVYALGLETALPVWLASRIRRRVKYVFDDADRLVLIWSLPAPVERVIKWFERKVSADAITHIIPSSARYDYQTDTMVEVFNMPDAAQIEGALKLAKTSAKRKTGQKLMVYVNGWLDPTRGLTLIDGAVSALAKRGRKDIAFKVAVGNLTAEPPAFFNHAFVTYLGSLTHLKSMAEYKSSDVVLTFYDPAIRINQFAIPNKWGDAIAMETPVIVNDGVRTATPLTDIGAAFTTPFDDPEALADLLERLADNPKEIKAARKAVASLQSRYSYFNDAMAPALDALTT